jgi:hypothetical protein
MVIVTTTMQAEITYLARYKSTFKINYKMNIIYKIMFRVFRAILLTRP